MFNFVSVKIWNIINPNNYNRISDLHKSTSFIYKTKKEFKICHETQLILHGFIASIFFERLNYITFISSNNIKQNFELRNLQHTFI